MKSYTHQKIKLFEDNRDNHGDVIISLKKGWCFEKLGEHTGAFYNRKEAMDAVHTSVACTCSECMKEKIVSDNKRPTMVSSIKLDRTICCVELKEIWKNAYRMWLDNPGLMTSSQQDRLTAKLYKSAKQGVREIVMINGRSFCLVNVEGLPSWEV